MVRINAVVPTLAGCVLMMVAGLFEASFGLRMDRLFNSSEWSPKIIETFQIMSPLGCIAGSFLFCFLAELIGRKYTLMALSLPFIISSVIFEFSYNSTVLCLASITAGISIGGCFAVLPHYIGEIAEKSRRGMFTALLYPLYILGFFLMIITTRIFSLTTAECVVNFGSIILCILAGITFATVATETPYYYIKNGRENTAKITLQKIRNPNINPELEFTELQGKVEEGVINIEKDERIMTCLKTNGLFKAVIMILGFFLLRSVSGTYTFPRYSIFAFGVTSLRHETIAAFIIGSVDLATAMLGPILVDRIGRKLCLMISFAGMAISLIIYFAVVGLRAGDYNFNINPYLLISASLLFIASFNIGSGPMPFVLLGELLPLKTKMIASASLIGFFFGLRLIFCSQFIVSFGAWPFINIISSIVCVILVKIFYLETKGKSLNEIQSALNRA